MQYVSETEDHWMQNRGNGCGHLTKFFPELHWAMQNRFMLLCTELPNKMSQLRRGNSASHLSRLMTKPTKCNLRPAKTQISLGISLAWSVSSLSAWRKLELENLHADRTTVYFEPWHKPRARLGTRKTDLRPPAPPPSILILTVPRRYFCCGSLLLFVLLSVFILWFSYYVGDIFCKL